MREQFSACDPPAWLATSRAMMEGPQSSSPSERNPQGSKSHPAETPYQSRAPQDSCSTPPEGKATLFLTYESFSQTHATCKYWTRSIGNCTSRHRGVFDLLSSADQDAGAQPGTRRHRLHQRRPVVRRTRA